MIRKIPRVIVPPIIFTTEPKVTINEIRTRRFDLIDRGPKCEICGGRVAYGKKEHSPEECDLQYVREIMES